MAKGKEEEGQDTIWELPIVVAEYEKGGGWVECDLKAYLLSLPLMPEYF